MMIVVDNKIAEDPTLLVMADDGSGNSVKIPSMLIGYTDGQRLKDAIHIQEEKAKKHGEFDDESADEDHDDESDERGQYRDQNGGRRDGKGKQVIVQAEISLATKTKGKIDVDLWYTGTYEFLQSGWDLAALAKMQDVFIERINFWPRIVTTRCLYCTPEMKQKMCIENGRYCPVAPSEFDALQKTNPDARPDALVKQSIREECVFESLPESGKSHWFLYIDRLINDCLNPEEDIVPITAQCNDQVISDLSAGTSRS